MRKEKVVEAICCMAKDLREDSNRSMLDLLHKSRYSEIPDEISVEDIELHLREHSYLIDTWLLKSMDTRGTPAWYLKSPTDYPEGDGWIVGYYPGDQVHKFDDEFHACAFYIKRSIEQIHKSLSS